ncbi:hypothetical protein GCM10017750_47980 [Streptomyces racemochromogenes]
MKNELVDMCHYSYGYGMRGFARRGLDAPYCAAGPPPAHPAEGVGGDAEGTARTPTGGGAVRGRPSPVPQGYRAGRASVTTRPRRAIACR